MDIPPKPRRCTDLDNDDLDCLIKLCETRLATITKHIKRNSFADKTSILKAASQLSITLDKLRKLKHRKPTCHCDGA